jgi:hypothetical protein
MSNEITIQLCMIGKTGKTHATAEVIAEALYLLETGDAATIVCNLLRTHRSLGIPKTTKQELKSDGQIDCWPVEGSDWRIVHEVRYTWWYNDSREIKASPCTDGLGTDEITLRDDSLGGTTLHSEDSKGV